jgi:hypothetical protein
MAALRNLAITALRLSGAPNIDAAPRITPATPAGRLPPTRSRDDLAGARGDPTPCPFQLIAHRVACGKTRVVPQNRRPKARTCRNESREVRVLVTTWGSRGDVEPLAGLRRRAPRRRGHHHDGGAGRRASGGGPRRETATRRSQPGKARPCPREPHGIVGPGTGGATAPPSRIIVLGPHPRVVAGQRPLIGTLPGPCPPGGSARTPVSDPAV